MSPNPKDVENAMLQVVLSDDAWYPWSLSASAMNDCCDRLERALDADGTFEDGFVSQWGRLSQQAQQLWSHQAATVTVQ
ncbi:MAG: hypothetical protein AAGH78_12505 [Cyanobacteria bacterium P01_H01_bin.58]